MYIGIIARLLRVVRVRLLQLIRFLDRLESELLVYLTSAPRVVETQEEDEVDL